MTTELEKAIQEIERLQRENAQLRKKLGIQVFEPKADYTQSGRPAMGSNTSVEETQDTRTYRAHGLSIAAKPPVSSNFSSKEKVKLFRTLFRGREDIYASFWFNERTGKKGYSPVYEDPWSSRQRKPRKYLPLTVR